jgi:hypothetical protein
VEIKRLKTKGETMIERAESQFWAYNTNNKYSQQDLVLLGFSFTRQRPIYL